MTITRMQVGKKLSRIVKYNGIVYLCGQVAKEYVPDITEQTRTMLERVDEHLAEAGTDKSRILAATIYVRNAEDVSAMNDVWFEWMEGIEPPSRTCVTAAMPNSDILVEITVTAAE